MSENNTSGAEAFEAAPQSKSSSNTQNATQRKRIVIDATYDKGIRVATLLSGELDTFDFEVQDKTQMRGNIYLGKIARIEQSLQAAFVDFGTGKNGFLPFAEIHPDYYQISAEDKADIIRQMKSDFEDGFITGEDENPKSEEDGQGITESIKDSITQESSYDLKKFESIIRNKKYTINDVLKKDQLVLVQVLKEERGNKGATLTSYVSLAGKYLVFMPNSLKGNGISRKIEMPEERRRIKNLLSSFAIPVTASIVARTAAQEVPDGDLKNDCEYLLNLWNSIRDKTLKSQAPAFIHEEDNILRRAVRDYCDARTFEIVVEGETAYEQVKQHTQTLATNVKVVNYTGRNTAFVKYGLEAKVNELFSPRANLISGGYLIIQQTEALVSVDINSGRATGEQNIEETALKTNLEAVEEIARQIRLRNLSGLIVVDFIDMARFSNKKTIERAMKNVMQKDKVRVQVSRISQFGLLEISRQRTRPSFLEVAGVPCSHCNSTGFVKSLEYTAISLLRYIDNAVRDELMRSSGATEVAHVNTTHNLGSYVLNYKRLSLNSLEQTYGVKICINAGASGKDEDFWLAFTGTKLSSGESAKSGECIVVPQNEAVMERYDHQGFDIKPLSMEVAKDKIKMQLPSINIGKIFTPLIAVIALVAKFTIKLPLVLIAFFGGMFKSKKYNSSYSGRSNRKYSGGNGGRSSGSGKYPPRNRGRR